MKLSPFLLLLAVTPAVISSCSSKADPDPGPSLTREQLMDPTSCIPCHKDHYSDWSGSMHAYAAVDPVFLAMNERGQRETNGALGTFCVNCHAPMAVAAVKAGQKLADVPASLKGVTCFFCHSVDSIDPARSNNNPLHLADDGVLRGEYSDPVKNSAHRAIYSKLHDRDQANSSGLCGTCHDIATQHGANIERTFSEWQSSVFSRQLTPSDPRVGATCAQCHMHQSDSPVPIAQAPNVFARRTHSHSFPGVDVAVTPGFPNVQHQQAQVQAILSTTLQSAICVLPLGPNSSALRVIVDPVATGHSFPSGSTPDRRAWVEVVAYKAGAVIYQSGVVPDDADVLKISDPDLWLFRDCLFDDQGKQVNMFWQASSYESNTLPGLTTFDTLDPEYYKTHVIQNFPRDGNALIPGVPDRVTLRVRMRAMGIDFLDDLVASKDLDPAVRDKLAKIPPYTLGTHASGGYGSDAGVIEPYVEWTQAAAAAQGAVSTFVDPSGGQVTCVTTTSFKSNATRTPAVNHVKCKPF